MKPAALLLLILSPVLLDGSSIFIVSRIADPAIDPLEESAFRDALAAELSSYGFPTAVRGDRFAEEPGAEDTAAASPLNQARQAGAGYALVATLRNLNEELRRFSGYDTDTVNHVHSLDFSFRLLRADDGEALRGQSGSVRRTFRTTEGASTVSADATGELIGLAAGRIAGEVAAEIAPDDLAEGEGNADSPVEFRIVPRGIGMTVPEVVRLESGELYVTGEREDIVLDAVTALVDGVVAGTVPGKLLARPGLHQVKLEREGFEDWERPVNVRPDLELSVRMKATDEAIARFREQASFLEGLRTARTLTEAEAEKIRGIARMFEQSGLRYDIRVDTDEAIRIEQNNRTLMGDNPEN